MTLPLAEASICVVCVREREADEAATERGALGLAWWAEFRQAWGKLRRFWLVHFARAYVERQLVRRQGACERCGRCCELLFRCPHLRGTNDCRVYEGRCLQCRLFPIDERDLADVGGRCGFWFESCPPEGGDARTGGSAGAE